MGLFESHVPIDSITIMVQKEVADRMQEEWEARIWRTFPGGAILRKTGNRSQCSAKLFYAAAESRQCRYPSDTS